MPEQPNHYDEINERLDTRDEQFAQAHREEERAHRAVMADIRRLLREMSERERLADERWEEVHALNVALRDELKRRDR
jgi:hypothetical protein